MVMGYVPQAFKLYYIAVFKLYIFLQRLEHAMVKGTVFHWFE